MLKPSCLILVPLNVLLFFAAPVRAVPVTVNPGNMQGWSFYSTDSTGIIGTGSATGSFVNGPLVPPLGLGSAQFDTAVGSGDGSEQLRTAAWAGTRIDALTSLSYSTFVTSWNGQQAPSLTLWLDTTGDGLRDDRLWFEPFLTASPVLGVWQTWDVLKGTVYSDNLAPTSLANFLAAEPNAIIIDDAAQGIGGLRIFSGFGAPGDSFSANVDNFTIGTAAGTTTYDFEPAAPELDANSISMPFAFCLGVLMMATNRRRVQQSA